MCVCWFWGRNEARWELEFPGFVEDVVWVMDVTSLPSLRRLASSWLVLVDDLQPKTKIQTSESSLLPSAQQAARFNGSRIMFQDTPFKIKFYQNNILIQFIGFDAHSLKTSFLLLNLYYLKQNMILSVLNTVGSLYSQTFHALISKLISLNLVG